MSDAYCFFRISYSLTIQKMCPLWIKYAQSLSKNQNKPNMTKIFFGLSKEFQKLSNSFRILSMCQWNTALWEKRKGLHYQKTMREMTKLDRFLNNEKWHSEVVQMFTTFGGYCLLPGKQTQSHCSFMDTFVEKTFLSLEMHGHHHRLEWWNSYFLQRHIYKDMQMQ